MSTDVDGAGVWPSMSMREKSVVGAASGISSSLCARLVRHAVVCKEETHGRASGRRIEDARFGKASPGGCVGDWVARDGVVMRLLV